MAKKRVKPHSRIRRLREWIYWFTGYYNPTCWVCGQPCTDNNQLTEGSSADGWLLHHLDGNRDDNDPTNLVPVHRTCHSKWHAMMDKQKKDVRTPEAKKTWGETPRNFVSDNSRSGGSIRRGDSKPPLKKRRKPKPDKKQRRKRDE